MIKVIVLEALLIFSVFIMSIVAHELGHYYSLVRMQKKNSYGGTRPVVNYSFKKGLFMSMPDWLSKSEKINIIMNGILLGLVPIVFFIAITNRFELFVLFPMYALGCRWDIKELLKLKGVRQ